MFPFNVTMGLSKPSTPVKELRVKSNLSRAEVAVALGLKTEKTVERWELGKTQPNLTPLQTYKLVKLYHCSLEELVIAFQETAPRHYVFAESSESIVIDEDIVDNDLIDTLNSKVNKIMKEIKNS